MCSFGVIVLCECRLYSDIYDVIAELIVWWVDCSILRLCETKLCTVVKALLRASNLVLTENVLSMIACSVVSSTTVLTMCFVRSVYTCVVMYLWQWFPMNDLLWYACGTMLWFANIYSNLQHIGPLPLLRDFILKLAISSSHPLICASYSSVFNPSSFQKAKYPSKYLKFSSSFSLCMKSLNSLVIQAYSGNVSSFAKEWPNIMSISWVESSSMLWCLSVMLNKMCRYGGTTSDGSKSKRGNLTQLWLC